MCQLVARSRLHCNPYNRTACAAYKRRPLQRVVDQPRCALDPSAATTTSSSFVNAVVVIDDPSAFVSLCRILLRRRKCNDGVLSWELIEGFKQQELHYLVKVGGKKPRFVLFFVWSWSHFNSLRLTQCTTLNGFDRSQLSCPGLRALRGLYPLTCTSTVQRSSLHFSITLRLCVFWYLFSSPHPPTIHFRIKELIVYAHVSKHSTFASHSFARRDNSCAW